MANDPMIYADYNAATPPLPEVVAFMRELEGATWGNPSSVHQSGRQAKARLEQARETLASLLGAEPKMVFFTSGGTESNNWVIHSVGCKTTRPHLAISAVEHPSVRQAAKQVAARGGRLTILPVDRQGILCEESYCRALAERPDLISIIAGNNEIGTLMPTHRFAEMAREQNILIHGDFCQCVGKVPVNFMQEGIDFMTISSHKCYGPKGIGALVVRKPSSIERLFCGGGQEYGLRAGTENVVAICGMVKAIEVLYSQEYCDRLAKVEQLRDYFEERLVAEFDAVCVHAKTAGRLPNTSHIAFLGVEAQSLVMNLDLYGIACSAGSACHSGSPEPSAVLAGIGLSPEEARASVRFSFGLYNSRSEIDRIIESLRQLVPRLRQ